MFVTCICLGCDLIVMRLIELVCQGLKKSDQHMIMPVECNQGLCAA